MIRQLTNIRSPRSRAGFTVLEMLIAMAITLLMMAALGRTFKTISDTIASSRTNVALSSQLRTFSYRISNELGQVTTRLDPPRSTGRGEGYFMYYDGPMTDATTIQTAVVGTIGGGVSVPGVSARVDQADFAAYFPISRFGDLDDVLSFTAVAEEGNPFKGIVPFYILAYKDYEQAVIEADRRGIARPNLPVRSDEDWLRPTVITSRYAEIVYWLSPERNAAGVIIDNDNDLMPDRLFLRRRILLIRPDLNIDTDSPVYISGLLPAADNRITSNTDRFNWATGYIPYYRDSGGNLQMAIGGNSSDPADPLFPRPLTTIHQRCDLSVRRPENIAGVQQPQAGGQWCQVIANSIADVTLPQNRFAHVRVPNGFGPFAGFSQQFTSMPVLDLLGVEGLFTEPSISMAIERPSKALGGFLNPAYELMGNRLGEDIVLANVIGFDIRGYDNQAPVMIHVGPDGFAGSAGDDDGVNGADGADAVYGEFGFQGSDDLVLTPNDPGFHALMRSPANRVSDGTVGVSNAVAVMANQGAFVDLDYVFKAGGNVQRTVSTANAADFNLNCVNLCQTPLSGLYSSSRVPLGTGGWSQRLFPTSPIWLHPTVNRWRSGKLVVSGSTALINQPTYDTWATDFEADLHNQGSAVGVGVGTVWPYNVTGPATFDPYLDTTNPFRIWPNQIDEGMNDLDDQGSFPGVDDAYEMEAPAPFDYQLPAIQIRVRVIDPSTQNIRQVQITQDFPR